jgi:hypothetical protein
MNNKFTSHGMLETLEKFNLPHLSSDIIDRSASEFYQFISGHNVTPVLHS